LKTIENEMENTLKETEVESNKKDKNINEYKTLIEN